MAGSQLRNQMIQSYCDRVLRDYRASFSNMDVRVRPSSPQSVRPTTVVRPAPPRTSYPALKKRVRTNLDVDSRLSWRWPTCATCGSSAA